MAHAGGHFAGPGIPDHILILATGQQDQRLVEGGQGGQRPLRRGGDGVVDVGHAVNDCYPLQPVLHALEGADRLAHGSRVYAHAVGQGDGSQNVTHVVPAAQLNVIKRANGRFPLTIT